MPATKFKLIGLALLFAVLNSQALTLGRMRGAALIGQGLDVSVQVQVDQDESLSAQCFEADVFHGDTRIEPNRLQVVVEPTQTAQMFNVRVSSPTLVDEPVVTVYLRSLCSQKTSRRYVLLADFATDQLAPAMPRVAQVPLITPANSTSPASIDAAMRAASLANVDSAGRTAQASMSRSTPARSRARQTAAAEKSASVARIPKTPRLKEAVPTIAKLPAEQKLQASRSSGQSRLKLEPLEAVSGSITTLESAPAAVAAEIAAREARDIQRLQALEASVKNLLTVATRNEAALADMKVRLERAQSERYQNPLVYGLIAFTLICLALFAFALVRISRRSANGNLHWSSGSTGGMQTPAVQTTRAAEAVAEQTSGPSLVSAPPAVVRPEVKVEVSTEVHAELPEPGPSTLYEASPIPVQAPVTQVDVSLVEMSESTFDRLMQTDDTHSGVRRSRSTDPGQAAMVGNRKSVNSEDLFDIRQQAEFFVSLGQTDQAVRILENRISENRESSPLAYLDLLKIFHSLGLRADFRQVREDFSLLFNARLPEFSNFNDEGRELEEYPDMLAEITASWGTPMVFAAIEVGLFRDQWKLQDELFDLAAFRDLLLLHAVAQGAASAQDSSHGPASKGVSFSASPGFAGRVAQRSNAISHPLDSTVANTPLPVIDESQHLDIDLTDLNAQAVSTTGEILPATTAPPASFNAGNLIDFDLTDSQIAAISKIRK